MRLRIFSSQALLAAAVVSLVGCGSRESSTHRVHGEVSYQRKPLASGTVMFQPASGKTVIGAIQSDGTFELRAAAGLYRVGVVSLAEVPAHVDVWKSAAALPPPPVPPKYHRPETSGITAEVTPSENNEINIALSN